MSKPKSAERTIAEMRSRHLYCVTLREMQKSYMRSPDYVMITPLEFQSQTSGKIRQVLGHCDFPSDPICANLITSDEEIKNALNGDDET